MILISLAPCDQLCITRSQTMAFLGIRGMVVTQFPHIPTLYNLVDLENCKFFLQQKPHKEEWIYIEWVAVDFLNSIISVTLSACHKMRCHWKSFIYFIWMSCVWHNFERKKEVTAGRNQIYLRNCYSACELSLKFKIISHQHIQLMCIANWISTYSITFNNCWY